MAVSVQTKNFTDAFSEAVIDLAGSFPIRSGKGKKLLLSIRDLKKYFPVKGHKDMFVKANDGITIDIYEGETLGLVGESGCGKSTLGRTLLQLYTQTEGRTFFYGQPLDRIAPHYLLDTLKNLPGNKRKLMELYAADRRAASSIERTSADSSSAKLFLDLVQFFGGLLLSNDDEKIITAYTEYYNASTARNKALKEITEARVARASNKNLKAETVQEAEAEEQKTLFEAEEKLKEKTEAIEEIRQSMQDIKGFYKLENLREAGIDLARLGYNEMRHLRKDMQIIFQDPYSSLNPRMTVGQIIGEGPLAHGFFTGTGEALQDHVMRVMEDCGLAPYMIHRYPHQFSGGQRQRIGIARSLAVRPKFVVCDEAVSALDVSIQSQILNLLSDLKEKEKLTYLFISHDLSVVKYISDRIGVMYLGNIVELAGSEEIFRHPLHPYTEALLSAIPTTRVDKPKNPIILEGDIPSPINPPKGCKFHTRCRYVTDICKKVTPPLTENSPGHFAACHHCLA
jgi:peptide/nickel transport system ATP-binding protein